MKRGTAVSGCRDGEAGGVASLEQVEILIQAKVKLKHVLFKSQVFPLSGKCPGE